MKRTTTCPALSKIKTGDNYLMGQSRPKPCGCSSNAFLSGDVCGAAHGRRTLLSAFTAHVGSSGGTAGPVSGGLRRRRPPEPSSERHRPPLHSQVCRSRPAWLPGQRLSFPSSARTGTPPAEGVGGARPWNTHDGQAEHRPPSQAPLTCSGGGTNSWGRPEGDSESGSRSLNRSSADTA